MRCPISASLRFRGGHCLKSLIANKVDLECCVLREGGWMLSWQQVLNRRSRVSELCSRLFRIFKKNPTKRKNRNISGMRIWIRVGVTGKQSGNVW